MRVKVLPIIALLCCALTVILSAASVPTRSRKGIVASQNEAASQIGADAIKEGGTAVDAAVATAFALAEASASADAEVSGVGRAVHERRHAVRAGRHPEAAGARAHAGAHRE